MPSRPRLNSIDQFRGFAILGMVIANFLAGANVIPDWSKHASDIGFTWVDQVAPFFIFAVSLTYRPSFQRRLAEYGWKKALGHFFRRWLALIAIGFLIVTAEAWFNIQGEIVTASNTNWGVLQAIGLAGLLTLPFLALPGWSRALTGLGLLVVYQVLLDRVWLPVVMNSPHGGIQGALGWTGMLLLATVLADLFNENERIRRVFPWAAAGVLAAGLLLAWLAPDWAPISKNRVSSSYVLLSLGISGVVFWGFHWLEDGRHLSLPVLTTWGRNPLVLYVLHLILLGFFALPPIPGWFVEAPLWLVLVQCLALLAALTGIGMWLNKRGWIFSL